MRKNILPIVHLVDTEGPFFETLDETFRQLKEFFGIDLKPNDENLKKVQSGLNLPDEVLRKIYYENALQLFPSIPKDLFK